MAQVHELPDGTTIAYFDSAGVLTDDKNAAVRAILITPEDEIIYAVRDSQEP